MGRILDSVQGHHGPISQFLKAHEEDRLPSTFLLVGPSGVGKRKTAWGFAQALLCETSKSACGQCANCLRVERGSSESVLFIEPEGTQIKVERGRDILDFLSLQRLGKARVVILDQAHLLNVQAGNALLKTLEEPPEATYIFLIAPSSSAVLPTIRSRAQALRFSPLSNQELRAVVDAPDWVIASSQGRVDLAHVLGDESWAEAREDALAVLIRTLSHEGVEPEKIKDLVKDKNMALFSVLIWQKLLRDVRMVQAGSHDIVNVDRLALIEEISALDPAAISRLWELALDLEGPIHGNVDRTLLVENFLMKARRLADMGREDVLFYGMD